jgi:hypothetical protein
MSKVWYGSLQNRLEENKQYCDEIKVGTGMTEYSYSDRHAYEVIAVENQKRVTVRLLDHKLKGEPMTNDWELISNEDNPTYELVKRGKYWYSKVVVTSDILDEIDREEAKGSDEWVRLVLFLAHNNIDRDVLREKGKVTRYHRWNVSFGVADYYYDYEF